MRRSLIKCAAVAIAVVGMLLLFGCAPAKPSAETTATEATAAETAAKETAAPGEKIHLVFWHWGEQEAPGLEKWIKETIDLYQQQNPNITIEPVLQATETLISAFRSAAAAKSGPDIQYFWGGVFTVEDAMLGNILPISDYVPKEEVAHWPYAYEVEYDGKVWAAPWYVVPNPMVYNKEIFKKAGLDPEKPPETWQEFLDACAKIKAAGIVPLSLGGKEGFAGAWLASYLGIQQYDSMKELMAPAIGIGKYTDPKYAEWWKRLAELRDNGYINEDFNSLEFYQGQDNFKKGMAGFTLTVGSGVVDFVKTMGADKVGVMKFPKWGSGKLAGRLQVSSQTVGITAWTKYPEEAAKFIMFMKTPERLAAMYKESGALPSDDRFDPSLLGTEQEKKMMEWMKEPVAPWGENYIPTQLDEQAYYYGVQEFFSEKRTPEEMAQKTQQIIESWQKENPDMLAKFKKWYESLKD